jgi:hypothetical protein
MVERKCQKRGLPTLLPRVFAPVLKLKVKERHGISAFFFIAACLWFLLPNFANQFFFLPSGMVTSLSHVLLEKLLSSLLDPKFPLQSVARNSPLAQFLGHPVLPRFQSLLSLTSTNKAKLGQGLRRNP